MPHGISPPPGVACTTNKEGSKDTNRFQALYRPEHAALKQGLRRGSGRLSALIHRGAWNRNSRKFISTIPDIHSYRAGAELYSSTSSMLWVGSCGQFALDWFGLHSILVPPPGTMISCPTYSIFPGKRKSSSMHRNVLSTSFRSGSLAIFPLAVGGLFLALSMHELRLRRILRS